MHTFGDLGIDTRGKVSGTVKTLCPQCSHLRKKKHEPCLSVDLDEGLYHCFNPECGWAGALSSDGDSYGSIPKQPIVQRPQGFTKPIAPPEQETLAKVAVDFLAGRGITQAVWERNRIGFVNNAITYPYHRAGELVNVKHRGRGKKFWMEAGAELILYGTDDIAAAAPLVWVEGEMDKLAVAVAGIVACVSPPNGAPSQHAKNYAKHFAYLETQVTALGAVQRHILAVDNDAAGRTLQDELVRRLGPERCWLVTWPEGCKDANEVLVQHGAAMIAACIAAAKPVPVEGVYEVNDLRAAVHDLYERGLPGGVHPGSEALAKNYRPAPGQWTIVTGIPSHGKALSLDTRLPTPDGWTTMGDVGVGDWLIDEAGQPCRVIAVTPVMQERDCYRMTFSDGAVIVCDAEHQWLTRDNGARLSARNARANGRDSRSELQLRGNDQTHLRRYPSVKTTREIAGTLLSEGGKRANHAVAMAAPLDLPDCDLPIEPYVLGAWLGDGTTANGSMTTGDPEIIEQFRWLGYTVTTQAARYRYGILGLQAQLRAVGVLGAKHIPSVYLRASVDQRLFLLQGLMDTDGSVTPYGRCEFTNINAPLSRQVFELVASLGWQPTWIEGRATISGRDCGPKYRVMFTPFGQVFRLARKQRFVQETPSARLRHRSIVACDPVASVPVRCVQVDSPAHLYLAGESMIPTHNSTVIDWLVASIARKHGWQFAVCSPENQPLQRHIASIAAVWEGKPFGEGPNTRMTVAELDTALDSLQEHFTFLLPPEDFSIDSVLALARTAVYRRGIRGLVIDPWNELEHNRPVGQREDEHISEVLTKIRRFARKYGVHVWLIAHPRTLVKDKDNTYPVPTLYDISGGSQFRNKADMGLSIWRDVNDKNAPTQVHVLKVRFEECGEIGLVELYFDPVSRRFMDYGPISHRYVDRDPWGEAQEK